MADQIDALMWEARDEQYYTFISHKYKNRRALLAEAEEKRKLAEKIKDTDPHYTRAQMTSEMAAMRVDLAYMLDRNRQLEQYIETIEFMHQRLGIVEGAYSHVKMLAEMAKTDYTLLQNALKKINQEPPK